MPLPLLDRISDYVWFHAEVCPDREAFTHDTVRLTYAAAVDRVAAEAKALVAAGVRKGDRVAWFGDPRPEFFISFLATSAIGAIWQGLNPKYREEELAHVLDDAGPRVILGLHGTETERLETVVRRHLPDASLVGTTSAFERFLESGAGVTDRELARARASVLPGDPAALVYTSGSSGRPKGALLPHRGLVRCCLVQAEYWYEEAPRHLCDLPVNHVGCLGDICSAVLVAGGTIHFVERFDRVEVLRAIARERIEYWGAVPTMLQLAVDTPQWQLADLSSLKRVMWGGARASRELIEHLRARVPKVSTSYGMTETVGSVTFTADDDDLDALGRTVGRPDPRYDVRVATPDGRPCDTGVAGEVQVRGDFIMCGYLHQPEATASTIDPDGWLHTGDLGFFDDAGRLRLQGRLSDMYKSGGYNVYPREVELALEEHPAVAVAAVVGVPDELYGEVGAAFVACHPDAVATARELEAFLRQRLANYKVPKTIEVRDELPRLAVGKVDKASLARGVSPRPPAEDVDA